MTLRFPGEMPLAQGVRSGIAIACLTLISSTCLSAGAVPARPEADAYDAIRVVLMGVVLAWIKRSPSS